METRRLSALALGVSLALAAGAASANDPGRVPTTRLFPTGSVIFFHPDGTGANHWGAARMYFKGADRQLNWDLLPNMALYRGHMSNNLSGTSNGGATTHAFGWKVDGLGSFGKDGDGSANPPTDQFINNLAGFQGSIMRQAANAGIPVGVINDGHIAEPGTGAFLAEVGNRGNWQEITRQMIQGRPGFSDTAPWVIMGGGEADTRPAGTTLVHRNHNQERGQALNSALSLRTDALDLELDWDDNGTGGAGGVIGVDDWIVVKTRAQFEALRIALANDPNYAPHVLGIFAFQDMFNDRNEADLIARGKVTTDPVNFVGPLTGTGPGFRSKASRLVLFGDLTGNPGFNPPTFREMTEVTIQILDRAARQQANPANRRFFLVAEQESNDNFGNNDNAVGLLQSLNDTDESIGVARNYVAANPRTLVLTAADSDAGGMQVLTPYRDTSLPCRAANVGGAVTNTTPVNNEWPNYGLFGTVTSNPATGAPTQPNLPDGLEGRGANTPRSVVPPNLPVPPADLAAGSRSFLSEADANGVCHDFAIAWSGTADYSGGMVSRATGLNAGLLNSVFSARFDNIDVYRMMHLTLFGNLPNYPATTFPTVGAGLR